MNPGIEETPTAAAKEELETLRKQLAKATAPAAAAKEELETLRKQLARAPERVEIEKVKLHTRVRASRRSVLLFVFFSRARGRSHAEQSPPQTCGKQHCNHHCV